MGQFLTEDRYGQANAGQQIAGKGSPNGQSINEVVHCIAKYDHPGDGGYGVLKVTRVTGLHVHASIYLLEIFHDGHRRHLAIVVVAFLHKIQ